MEKKVLAGVIVLNLNIEFHVNLPIEAVDVVLNTMKEDEDESNPTPLITGVCPVCKNSGLDPIPFTNGDPCQSCHGKIR